MKMMMPPGVMLAAAVTGAYREVDEEAIRVGLKSRDRVQGTDGRTGRKMQFRRGQGVIRW